MRTFIVLASASAGLVLCIVAWILSYSNEHWYKTPPLERVVWRQREGFAGLSNGAVFWIPESHGLSYVWPNRSKRMTYWKFHAPKAKGTNKYYQVLVPLWIPTFLCTLVAAFSGRKVLIARRRRKLGLCLRCGYDLRGTDDKCPECGCVLCENGAKQAGLFPRGNM